ncbi:MAG: LytR/AlgR family response regulator transcription factor [Candidatus Cryptobacteroides sp.]
MRALIVEDELMAKKSLTRLLAQNFPDIDVVAHTMSVKDTIEWLASNEADLIFMDVELSDGDCFEIFRSCEIKAKVIMTTAYNSYAIKAFEAGSIDYLLKPIETEALKRAVNRAKYNPAPPYSSFPNGTEHKKERFLVRLNDRIIPVKIEQIAYFYSEDKTNYMMTFDRQRYIMDSSLDIINEELDSKQFFRISRSCIVSVKAISSITKQMGGRLKISPTPTCDFDMTVSRSRVDDFLAWLE